MDAFAKLFEDETFYMRVTSEMAKAMYLNLRNNSSTNIQYRMNCWEWLQRILRRSNMKTNKLYKSLLEKSVGSMLSAIEIYNKPDFNYREESFAILSVNAWELLMKAFILKLNHYKVTSLYQYKKYKKNDGTLSNKKRVVDTNRCGNAKTITIQETMHILELKGLLPKNLRENLEALIELRDNSIHFTNIQSISKQIQELGFACIRNYISITKKWELPLDFSKYNFYLMPLAYVDGKVVADSVLSAETTNYINLIKRKISSEDTNDSLYSIAISIDIDFKKGNSFGAIGMCYAEDGVKVTLSEEDIKKKYPLTYQDIFTKAKNRYTDFKRDNEFHTILNEIKKNDKLCYVRKLDNDNPKSAKKEFYSSAIWFTLDKKYKKK